MPASPDLAMISLMPGTSPFMIRSETSGELIIRSDQPCFVEREQRLIEGLHAGFARFGHDLLDARDIALHDQVGDERRVDHQIGSALLRRARTATDRRSACRLRPIWP